MSTEMHNGWLICEMKLVLLTMEDFRLQHICSKFIRRSTYSVGLAINRNLILNNLINI